MIDAATAILSETYDLAIGFVQWMMVGVPLVIVSLPLAWLLLTRVLHPVGAAPLAGGRDALLSHARSLGALSRAEWTVGIVTAMTHSLL